LCPFYQNKAFAESGEDVLLGPPILQYEHLQYNLTSCITDSITSYKGKFRGDRCRGGRFLYHHFDRYTKRKRLKGCNHHFKYWGRETNIFSELKKVTWEKGTNFTRGLCYKTCV